jgi:hypothetical protein
MTVLTHLSESRLEELRASIDANLDRYRGTGFQDLAGEQGWAIDLGLNVDLARLDELDGSDNRAETDLRDTLVMAEVLKDLSPSLANEERIWARLSHVEGFAYSQRRWLRAEADDVTLAKAVEIHFFARTQTRLRDDHALSRLWWNAHVARHCYPHDVERGLELLLTSADVRSNLVERIWLTGRRKLAGGVFRAMDSDPFVLEAEGNFRTFMKSLNRLGGGVVFEAMTDAAIDDFLKRCSEDAAATIGLNGREAA